MTSIIVFITLTLLSYVGVFYIRRLALRYNILDNPNERSSHSIPMPLGGGLGIVILVLIISIVFADQTQVMRSLIYIVLGAVLALVGWRDDLLSLSAHYRFAVQGLVAAISIL